MLDEGIEWVACAGKYQMSVEQSTEVTVIKESEGQLWTAFCQRLSSGIGIQRAQRVARKVLEVQVLVMKSATRCLGWPLFDQSVSNNLGSTVV